MFSVPLAAVLVLCCGITFGRHLRLILRKIKDKISDYFC